MGKKSKAGRVRIFIPIDIAESLQSHLQGCIEMADDEPFIKQMKVVIKRLQIQLDKIPNVTN